MPDDDTRSSFQRYQDDPLAVNREMVERYRATAGHIPNTSGPSGMLLLTTTGARTGEQHTAPMMYRTDGDRLVVFASNAGGERAPGWYHNLVAHPDVTVEVGADRFAATAEVTSGDERERLWRLFPFPEHQEKAGREIPVVVLERR
ncbi:MAG TPA: nitroreductase family deazaflavin-dependent oxidoreductase [Candidatus Dormibacteraeota bacterium]|jgi:deazaflavin-dependent oxidoreductase (nitroreductase family)